jgi:hypothetical protein
MPFRWPPSRTPIAVSQFRESLSIRSSGFRLNLRHLEPTLEFKRQFNPGNFGKKPSAMSIEGTTRFWLSNNKVFGDSYFTGSTLAVNRCGSCSPSSAPVG